MPEAQQDATYILADLHNRVRSLESKYNLLGERVLMVNQNMIEEYKKTSRDMHLVNDDLRELKQEVALVREAIHEITKELDSFAKKASVKVLEKYINLLSPLHFVTEEQLKKEIEQIGRKKNG